MGIPYYFAALLRKHKGIVQTCRSRLEPDIFAIDLNCLIHRYLKEDQPIQSILDAMDEIMASICRPKQLYIAADGLAPYAKIVNQRHRRFKKQERGSFDRNQISPDTPYMRELLTSIKRHFPLAIVSDSAEPGEGEQKIFAWLKTVPKDQRKSICIYGLDADLILLSLANQTLSAQHQFWLLRESSDFAGTAEKTPFSLLSIWGLSGVVPMPLDQYMCLSILCFGNDFMPTLSLLSLREDGYNRSLQIYNATGCPDLTTPDGLRTFLSECAKREKSVLLDRAQKRAKPFENAILCGDGSHMEQRHRIHLLDGERNLDQICRAFWTTYEWTLQYFTTNQVPDWSWYYPYAEAPLVDTLLKSSWDVYPLTKSDPPYTVDQQLQCILPSWSLQTAERPKLFEDELYDEETDMRPTWMKQYTWETEPYISLPWHPTWKLTTTTPMALL